MSDDCFIDWSDEECDNSLTGDHWEDDAEPQPDAAPSRHIRRTVPARDGGNTTVEIDLDRLPAEAGYVAMDASEYWWWYQDRPDAESVEWVYREGAYEWDEVAMSAITIHGPTPDWRHTRIDLEEARREVEQFQTPYFVQRVTHERVMAERDELCRQLEESKAQHTAALDLLHRTEDKLMAALPRATTADASGPPDVAVGWQPIETAPVDGSHIQLYRPEIQFAGYHAQAGWCANGQALIEPPPTHWRPLLAPPSPDAMRLLARDDTDEETT